MMNRRVSSAGGGNRSIFLALAFSLPIALVLFCVAHRDAPYNSTPILGDSPWLSTSLGQTEEYDATAIKPSRRLEFVHIPKTGGTAIESEAARHNITWSICHFGIPQNVRIISLNETVCHQHALKHPWPGKRKYHNCPWWHIPPQYFELHEVNPYAGADLFCVVRNPYDRLISEYFYEGTYITKKTMEEVNDAGNLNMWVEKFIPPLILDMKRGDIGRNRTGNGPYFRSAGHFIPQYDYVFEHRRRIIKHVLRFENLVDEFHALMELYDLPLRLPTRKVRPSHSKTIVANNLTRKSLELIERLYQDDFREWGYEILSSKQ
jgi:hypothetical protein